MSRVTAPLLGFGASGQIGKAQVYSSWRGINYARRYAIPSNPNTLPQQATRGIFTWLTQTWKNAPIDVQRVWTLFAKAQPFTDRNAFIKLNAKNMNGDTDISHFHFADGAKGGPALATAVFSTTGAGNATVTFTRPTAPTDWSYGETTLAVLLAQDPTASIAATIVATSESGAGPLAIDDLPTGTYRMAAWMQWVKPDASLAYSTEIVSAQAIA